MERGQHTNNQKQQESDEQAQLDSGKQSQKNVRTKGTYSRDARRLAKFNEKKAEYGSWANQIEAVGRSQEALTRVRNQRTSTYRPKVAQMKATTETPPKDGILYEGSFSGGKPSIEQNTHNMDYSAFPLFCEQTYQVMEINDGRLRRRMPFCMYQHYITEILNAYLIKHSMAENED